MDYLDDIKMGTSPSYLTPEEEKIIMRLFLNASESSVDPAIKKSVLNFEQDVYEMFVLNYLKQNNIGEDILIKNINNRMTKNRESLDKILKEYFGDGEHLDYLKKIFDKKLNDPKYLDPLDKMTYTGGKTVDEFLKGDGTSLSQDELKVLIKKVNEAKLSDKELKAWAEAAKKDQAFFSEFGQMLTKSAETLKEEINILSVAFKREIENEKFLLLSPELQEQLIAAYTTKITSKLNSLDSKIAGESLKLMKQGDLPPQIITFLSQGQNKETTFLYLKRFYNLRPEDEITTLKEEINESFKSVLKSSLELMSTTYTKLIREGGPFRQRFVNLARSYDIRTDLGTYFFTNQFLGVRRFTDFAIRQNLFASGQSFSKRFAKYGTLLAMSYIGYMVFAAGRALIEGILFGSFKLLWNRISPGEDYDFNIDKYSTQESLIAILVAMTVDSFKDQFLSFFTSDGEDKNKIWNAILAMLPTLGLTSVQNSMAAKIAELLTGKNVNSALEEIPRILLAFEEGTVSSDEVKEELETETGKKVPEMTEEQKNDNKVNEKKSTITNSISGHYFRAVNYPEVTLGAKVTTTQKEKLLSKISYEGKPGTYDENQFYINLDGKKYRYMNSDTVESPDGQKQMRVASLGKDLWENRFIMDLNKKIITETLGLKTNSVKNFSSKKQKIVISEEQLEKLLIKLNKK